MKYETIYQQGSLDTLVGVGSVCEQTQRIKWAKSNKKKYVATI